MSRWFQFSLRSLLCAVMVAAAACAMLRLVLDEEAVFDITNRACDVAIDGDGFFQVIDPAAMVISADGSIWIQQSGQSKFSQVGQLQLAKFPDPQRLLKVDENVYRETPLSGAAIVGQSGADDFGSVLQNQLERRQM